MTKTGGFTLIDLTSKTLYKDVANAILMDKAFLIVGDDVPYYADEVTYDQTDDVYSITKGGQVIEIANDNTITKTGNKYVEEKHLYVYTIDTGDATIPSDISFPRGNYISFISNEKLPERALTSDDSFTNLICLQGSYLVGSFNNDIIKLSIIGGEIIVVSDSSDYDSTIATDYDGIPSLEYQLL